MDWFHWHKVKIDAMIVLMYNLSTSTNGVGVVICINNSLGVSFDFVKVVNLTKPCSTVRLRFRDTSECIHLKI